MRCLQGIILYKLQKKLENEEKKRKIHHLTVEGAIILNNYVTYNTMVYFLFFLPLFPLLSFCYTCIAYKTGLSCITFEFLY